MIKGWKKILIDAQLAGKSRRALAEELGVGANHVAAAEFHTGIRLQIKRTSPKRKAFGADRRKEFEAALIAGEEFNAFCIRVGRGAEWTREREREAGLKLPRKRDKTPTADLSKPPRRSR